MKKLFTLVVLLVLSLGVSAQTQVVRIWNNGAFKAIPISEVDSITFFTRREIPEHAVDLGLPSGTLWADRNVGADSPEAYGDHFSWGETSPNDFYEWKSYKWCEGSNSTITKYCTDSQYGTLDNKDTLDPEDDAATVNMGSEWRMPTYDEFDELIKTCTWEWSTHNDTKGYKITGPNGNSIFLPAAGYRYARYQDLYDDGAQGFYWLASIHEKLSYQASSLIFHSGSHYLYAFNRYSGRTIRGVAR
jgi:hypothetical protein